ncbi:MAG: glycosyltransferase [Candidatus Aminicenantes bacterium]|nr:glycosyltransferase [Candidatus Aminicenantes bacterium]
MLEKILFTITGPWGTGAATVVDGVAHELMRRGYKIKVVFPDLGLPSPEKDKYYGNPSLYHIIKFPVKHQGIRFHTFPLMIPDPNPRNIKDAWTFKDMTKKQLSVYLAFLKDRLIKLIKDFQPDVIETEHVWLMGYALYEMGCSYIVGAHNSDQMGFHFDSRMRPFAIACAQNAKYIFSISDIVKKKCLKLYRVPSEKIVVIPNGYDERIFHPRRMSKKRIFKKYNIGADISLPVVTFGGKMSKTKGVDILLKANALLQKRLPYLLFLFGSGDIKNVLGKTPSEEEARNTYFMGHVTQETLAEFHNIADFSVLPSRQEGFGVAALEAMGCGLPMVVTSATQAEPYIIGKIVPSENASQLAEAMESLLILPHKEMKKLREEAYKKVLKFSWKENVAKRLTYYKTVVKAI